MCRHNNLASRGLLSAIIGFVMSIASVSAQEKTPAVRVNPQRDAYYGDLHLHTSYSFDAYLMGTKVDPDEAYRFAKGEVVNYLGQPAQRRQALDFMAVTDHAESFGLFNQLEDPTSVVSRSESGGILKELIAAHFSETSAVIQDKWKAFQLEFFIQGDNDRIPENLKAASRSAWQREIDMSNRNYQPGKFTTFIAYEWTASPYGDNLHRNVIFKGDTAPYPFSSLDSKRPEDLWTWLETIRKQGYEALAIPHNGNMSNGLMYDWVDSNTFPIDRTYAQRRQMNEPLSEIGQIKGSSETHPLLSPNDEFADYQIIDRVLLILREQSRPSGSYLRDALSRGLVLQRQVGVNPFKYGFVGDSDLHGGLSVSAQSDYVGGDTGANIGAGKPTKEQAITTLAEQLPDKSWVYDLKQSAGNLTGVWAESNTRDSIYAALRRRETFATSGSELKFRIFGGWDFDKHLPQQNNWIATAYSKGVPMGGDLPPPGSSRSAPRFAVWVAKDPNGANLDRAQIVKVWEEDGKQREQVFDVAWSGSRVADPKTGKLPAVGNTVDLTTGTYTNSIGAAVLTTVWEDPEFQADRFAAYYLRVLEIPTPRWSTLLAIRHRLPLPEEVPATEQQRGWASPIWYTPPSK
jgi:Protein of unknown function (DUF3604)